jgi:hypothetical protein
MKQLGAAAFLDVLRQWSAAAAPDIGGFGNPSASFRRGAQESVYKIFFCFYRQRVRSIALTQNL